MFLLKGDDTREGRRRITNHPIAHSTPLALVHLSNRGRSGMFETTATSGRKSAAALKRMSETMLQLTARPVAHVVWAKSLGANRR